MTMFKNDSFPYVTSLAPILFPIKHVDLLHLNYTPNLPVNTYSQQSFSESFLYIETTTDFSDFQNEPIVLIPVSGQIVLSILYGLVGLVAVGANALVVLLIVTTRRLRTNTNMFLASQALSDALMSLICVPSNLVNNVIYNAWIFADLLCPVYLFFQALSVLLSAFTMLAICCDRYKVVLYPLKPKLSKRSTLLIILLTWVLASLISSPIALKASVTKDTEYSNPVCQDVWEVKENRYIYSMVILVVQYFLPVSILAFTYTRIAYLLWGKKIPGEADNERDRRMEVNKKKMIRMMIIVVLIYALCWLPLHVLTLSLDANHELYNFSHIQHIWITCQFIAMSSLCYNPFVYFYMSSKFSEALYRSCFWRVLTWRAVKCCCCCYRNGENSRRESQSNLQSSHLKVQGHKLLPISHRQKGISAFGPKTVSQKLTTTLTNSTKNNNINSKKNAFNTENENNGIN